MAVKCHLDVFSKVSVPGTTKIGHEEVFTKAPDAHCILLRIVIAIVTSLYPILKGSPRSLSQQDWLRMNMVLLLCVMVASHELCIRACLKLLARVGSSGFLDQPMPCKVVYVVLVGCHLILTNNEGSLGAKSTCFPIRNCATTTPCSGFGRCRAWVQKLMLWLGPWLWLWNSCLDSVFETSVNTIAVDFLKLFCGILFASQIFRKTTKLTKLVFCCLYCSLVSILSLESILFAAKSDPGVRSDQILVSKVSKVPEEGRHLALLLGAGDPPQQPLSTEQRCEN